MSPDEEGIETGETREQSSLGLFWQLRCGIMSRAAWRSDQPQGPNHHAAICRGPTAGTRANGRGIPVAARQTRARTPRRNAELGRTGPQDPGTVARAPPELGFL